MTSDSIQTKKIAETFDDLAHDRCCKYKSKGLTASSEVLLGFLTQNGLVGKTVLDIGCGTGFFALETLRQGASSCIGVDLSSAAIHEANEFAKESGLQDREIGRASCRERVWVWVGEGGVRIGELTWSE